MSDFSAWKLAQWPDLVFQRRNIDLYIEQKSEVNNERSNN